MSHKLSLIATLMSTDVTFVTAHGVQLALAEGLSNMTSCSPIYAYHSLALLSMKVDDVPIASTGMIYMDSSLFGDDVLDEVRQDIVFDDEFFLMSHEVTEDWYMHADRELGTIDPLRRFRTINMTVFGDVDGSEALDFTVFATDVYDVLTDFATFQPHKCITYLEDRIMLPLQLPQDVLAGSSYSELTSCLPEEGTVKFNLELINLPKNLEIVELSRDPNE